MAVRGVSTENGTTPAVLLGLAVGSANATLLVSTSNTQTNFTGLNATTRLAQSFIAASTDLDNIYMWVSKGATSTGSIVITLRADNSGQPDATVLHSLGGPIAESDLPGSKAIVELFDIGINDLTVGDRYWIEMNSDSAGPTASARWHFRTGFVTPKHPLGESDWQQWVPVFASALEADCVRSGNMSQRRDGTASRCACVDRRASARTC